MKKFLMGFAFACLAGACGGSSNDGEKGGGGGGGGGGDRGGGGGGGTVTTTATYSCCLNYNYYSCATEAAANACFNSGSPGSCTRNAAKDPDCQED